MPSHNLRCGTHLSRWLGTKMPESSQDFVDAGFGGLSEGFEEFALSEEPVPAELI